MEAAAVIRAEVALQGTRGCPPSHVRGLIHSAQGLHERPNGDHRGNGMNGSRDGPSSSGLSCDSEAVWQRLLGYSDIALAWVSLDDQFDSRPSDQDLYDTSLSELERRYDQRLCVVAHPDLVYQVLTGRADRPSKLTARNYDILQFIAKARFDGVPSTSIGSAFQIDQKSVFHVIRTLIELKTVIKIRSIIQGTTTSIIYHVRYPPPSAAKIDACLHEGRIITKMWSEDRSMIAEAVRNYLAKQADYSDTRLGLLERMTDDTIEPGDRRKFQSILRTMVENRVAEFGNWTCSDLSHDSHDNQWRPDPTGKLIRLIDLPLSSIQAQDESAPSNVQPDAMDTDDLAEDSGEALSRTTMTYLTIEQSLIKLIQECPEGIMSADLAPKLKAPRADLINKIVFKLLQTQNPPHLSHMSILRVVDSLGRSRLNRFFSSQSWEAFRKTDASLAKFDFDYQSVSSSSRKFSRILPDECIDDISAWLAKRYRPDSRQGAKGTRKQRQSLSKKANVSGKGRGRPRKTELIDGYAFGPDGRKRKYSYARKNAVESDEAEADSAETEEDEYQDNSEHDDDVSERDESSHEGETFERQPPRTRSGDHGSRRGPRTRGPVPVAEPRPPPETLRDIADLPGTSRDLGSVTNPDRSTGSTEPTESRPAPAMRAAKLYQINLAARRFQDSVRRLMNLYDQVIERDELYAKFQHTHTQHLAKSSNGQVDRKTIKRAIDRMRDEGRIRIFEFDKTIDGQTKTVEVILRTDVTDAEARRKLQRRTEAQLEKRLALEQRKRAHLSQDLEDGEQARTKRFRVEDEDLSKIEVIRQKLLQADRDLCAWFYGFLPGRARQTSNFHLWLILHGYQTRQSFTLDDLLSDLDLEVVRSVHGIHDYDKYYNNLLAQQESDSRPLSSFGPLQNQMPAIRRTIARLLDDLLSLSLVTKPNPRSMADPDFRLGAPLHLSTTAPMVMRDSTNFRRIANCTISTHTQALQWWATFAELCHNGIVGTEQWPRPLTPLRSPLLLQNVDWCTDPSGWIAFREPNSRQRGLMRRMLGHRALEATITGEVIDSIARACVTVPPAVIEQLQRQVARHKIARDRVLPLLLEGPRISRRRAASHKAILPLPSVTAASYSGLDRRDAKLKERERRRQENWQKNVNETRRRKELGRGRTGTKGKSRQGGLIRNRGTRLSSRNASRKPWHSSEDDRLLYLAAATELKMDGDFADYSDAFFEPLTVHLRHRSANSLQKHFATLVLNPDVEEYYNQIKRSWIKSRLLDHLDGLDWSTEQFDDLLHDPALLRPHLFEYIPASRRPPLPSNVAADWEIRPIADLERRSEQDDPDEPILLDPLWQSLLEPVSAQSLARANADQGEIYFSIAKMMLISGNDEDNKAFMTQFSPDELAEIQSALGIAHGSGLVNLHARDLIRPTREERNTVFLTKAFWQRIDGKAHPDLGLARGLKDISDSDIFARGVVASTEHVAAVLRLLSLDLLQSSIDPKPNHNLREEEGASSYCSMDEQSIEVGLKLSLAGAMPSLTTLPSPPPPAQSEGDPGDIMVRSLLRDNEADQSRREPAPAVLSADRLSPRLWIAVDGSINTGLWRRCLIGLLCTLLHHSGTSLAALHERYRAILSRPEVDDLVAALHTANLITLSGAAGEAWTLVKVRLDVVPG